MKQRSVTVLGMHRSGTSLVTGVLKHLGVDMGEPNPPTILWDSPLGQIEDLEFVNLDDKILKAAGGSWDKPPPHEAIMQQKSEFAGRIRELIASKKSAFWGWKTCRNSLTIDLYLPYLPDPKFIVCRRDAEAVCQSLESRSGMDTSIGMELDGIYNNRLDSFVSQVVNVPLIFELKYESVSAKKAEFVDRITDFLGIRVNSDMRNRAIESILSHRAIRELSDNMKAMSDIKLNVGCGYTREDGWTGIDIRRTDAADIVWDLTHFPWPLASACCNEIKMQQVWEIIPPRCRMDLMDEMWRIAKPDCALTMTAPHANTLGAAQDPTHYGCPNEITFWYFDPKHPSYHNYRRLPWQITDHFMSGQNVCVRMVPMKEYI